MVQHGLVAQLIQTPALEQGVFAGQADGAFLLVHILHADHVQGAAGSGTNQGKDSEARPAVLPVEAFFAHVAGGIALFEIFSLEQGLGIEHAQENFPVFRMDERLGNGPQGGGHAHAGRRRAEAHVAHVDQTVAVAAEIHFKDFAEDAAQHAVVAGLLHLVRRRSRRGRCLNPLFHYASLTRSAFGSS